jgi:hypothetical protein
VLPKMARQILGHPAKIEKFANLQVPQIETGIAELAFQRVF